MKSKVFVVSLVILTAILLLFTLKPVHAQSLKVIPVPMVSTNPIIPHDTYNGVATTFKAIARGGTGTYNYDWDFNGDGTYDYSNSTSDPYNLSASYTYPDQASDRTFIAKIRVTSGVQTATAEYRVTIHSPAFLWVKINKAIDDGLWYLHTHQTRGTDANSAGYGYWAYSFPVAATGAATEAFELQGHLPEGDYDVNPYVETVRRGLNYLLGQTYVVAIFPQTAGNPDTNGNGIGLACDTSMGGEYIYENGISFTALATSNAPNRIAQTGPANVIGRAYKDIVQDMIDYLAFAQNDPESGPFRGGWRYNANSGDSDNSNSQWPVIAMMAAETNMGPSAIPPVVPPVVVPQFVKDELSIWIDYIQNDVSGGSGYADPFYWVNIAKTGGLLCEMAFYGDTAATPRAVSAINYIDANWDTDLEHFPSNSFYAFYSVMKGFRLLKIDTLPSGLDWYADPVRGYAPHLVNTQYADGSWVDGYFVGASYLADAWAIATLQPCPICIPLVAVAKANPKEAPPGAVIAFDHSGSYHLDPDRKLVAFRWDFDNDGVWDYETPDINAKPTHVYNDNIGCGEEVIHPVTLEVEDDAGNADKDTESVVIKINLFNHPPVPIGDPTPSDPNYEVSKGGQVLLDASASYDPDTGTPIKCDPNAPDDHIVKWEWDLNNDGTYDAEGKTYLFDTPDDWEVGTTHTVYLRVTDDGSWAGPNGGGSKPGETTVTILVVPSDNNIQVILPIGGEILPSGETSRNYGICWQAPSNAVKFDLYYSLNNGTSWNFIKSVTGLNCTHWSIPIVTVNKKECLVKVIGYDSNGVVIGRGISDKPFTIEVLRVLTPNGGETLRSGSTWAIKWKTNETIRPVAKVKLFYTTGEGSWPLIRTVTGNPETYNWKVPAESSTKCKVKVVLKDASGVNVGTDVSDRVFTIQP